MTRAPLSGRKEYPREDDFISAIFAEPDKLDMGYVQEMLIALHNAKTADGKPADILFHKASSPFNYLFAAVLHLLEKGQPGIMGYDPNA